MVAGSLEIKLCDDNLRVCEDVNSTNADVCLDSGNCINLTNFDDWCVCLNSWTGGSDVSNTFTGCIISMFSCCDLGACTDRDSSGDCFDLSDCNSFTGRDVSSSVVDDLAITFLYSSARFQCSSLVQAFQLFISVFV